MLVNRRFCRLAVCPGQSRSSCFVARHESFCYFSGDQRRDWMSESPPSTFTGFVSSFNSPLTRPSRVAVSEIVPAVGVERMATRLMPHSVFRYRLLVLLV